MTDRSNHGALHERRDSRAYKKPPIPHAARASADAIFENDRRLADLKSEGALRDWARRRIPVLAGAVLVVLGIAVIAAFIERARFVGRISNR